MAPARGFSRPVGNELRDRRLDPRRRREATRADLGIRQSRASLRRSRLRPARRALGGAAGVADAESEEIAQRALAAAFAAADSVAHLVVPNFEGSEVRAINDAAGKHPVAVSPWTEQIVLATVRWAERTNGAFEPTIGPLAALWGFGVEVDRPPSPEEIRSALQRVGYSKIEIDVDAHTIYLPDSAMRLDVRGAAKGSRSIGCTRR